MQGLNSVLTPEQQQNWAQMTGQPHNFPAGTYFGSQGQATQGQPNQGVGQNPAGVRQTGPAQQVARVDLRIKGPRLAPRKARKYKAIALFASPIQGSLASWHLG